MPILNQQKNVALTPTIDTAQYAAGDVIGGLLSFNTYSAGGGGILRRVIIADDDNEKAALTLYLFNAAPTTIADQASASGGLLIADIKKLVDVISIAATDYVTLNGNAYAIKNGLSIDYALTSEYLYAYLVAVATPTYTAATDLTITLTIWQD